KNIKQSAQAMNPSNYLSYAPNFNQSGQGFPYGAGPFTSPNTTSTSSSYSQP
ncbi:hypothetical protein ACJMK2_040613, partial [Sinanodonta woodiana]